MGYAASSDSENVPCGTASVATESDRTVVSLFGEHDLSTVHSLSVLLARSIDDDADVVVDLSGVVFMDASTVGVILHTESLLLPRSRHLTVRAPSSFARFVLDLCQRSELVELGSGAAAHLPGALASWIEVPSRTDLAGDRVDVDVDVQGLTRLPLDSPRREPQREDSTTVPATAASPDAESLGVPQESLQDGG